MEASSFVPKDSYSLEDLILCGNGELFGEGNARLPLPPMLMFDSIRQISHSGGRYGRGFVVAELSIEADLWFFDCHFRGDPVMPGCLGLDAMWQLIGFYLAWTGGLGRGRALGAGRIKFFGQVHPRSKKISYQVDLKRVIKRTLCMGIADADLIVDSRAIYSASDLRVGLFSQEEPL